MYTKKECPSCMKAKALLNTKGMKYTESVVGENILREDFVSLFPEVRSVPFIIIDGVKIGGYNQLKEHLDNRPEFIAG
jgi:glutaredoxin